MMIGAATGVTAGVAAAETDVVVMDAGAVTAATIARLHVTFPATAGAPVRVDPAR